jgi:hypothetical protein
MATIWPMLGLLDYVLLPALGIFLALTVYAVVRRRLRSLLPPAVTASSITQQQHRDIH